MIGIDANVLRHLTQDDPAQARLLVRGDRDLLDAVPVPRLLILASASAVTWLQTPRA